jgi:hypothetical protein
MASVRLLYHCCLLSGQLVGSDWGMMQLDFGHYASKLEIGSVARVSGKGSQAIWPSMQVAIWVGTSPMTQNRVKKQGTQRDWAKFEKNLAGEAVAAVSLYNRLGRDLGALGCRPWHWPWPS